jgi:hypothetical protein
VAEAFEQGAEIRFVQPSDEFMKPLGVAEGDGGLDREDEFGIVSALLAEIVGGRRSVVFVEGHNRFPQ